MPRQSKHCCRATAHLLRELGPDIKPEQMSIISDEELEECARACHFAMCWFVGILNDDPTRRHPLELQLLAEIPDMVRATAAVAIAKEEGILVLEALRRIDAAPHSYEDSLAGRTCFIWFDADGNTRVSGPEGIREEMDDYIRGVDILRTIRDVIGDDFRDLDLDVLDGRLSEVHRELAQLVLDDSRYDVSEETYNAFMKTTATLSEEQLKRNFDERVRAGSVEDWPAELDKAELGKALRRAILIRLHMMKAKIEERKRRRLILH
jgi:hypothetical protein